MVQQFSMFLNHFFLPLQVIYMYFCWLVFRLIVQKQWVHSLLTRAFPHCSSNWSPGAHVFWDPKIALMSSTGFPKPNRLVSFPLQSLTIVLQSLTKRLTRRLSTIVGRMKPNGSVLHCSSNISHHEWGETIEKYDETHKRYAHLWERECVCLCMYIYTYAYMCVHTYIHIYHTHTNTHTNTLTQR